MSKSISIWTDGACSGNPGPGGWAAILLWGEHKKEIHGREDHTTNNRMELSAVIYALQSLKSNNYEVIIHSDSAYVVNAIEKGWLTNWRQNGWKTANKKPVENQDLWKLLYPLLIEYKPSFIKVKGHSGIHWNEEADKLAAKAMSLP